MVAKNKYLKLGKVQLRLSKCLSFIAGLYIWPGKMASYSNQIICLLTKLGQNPEYLLQLKSAEIELNEKTVCWHSNMEWTHKKTAINKCGKNWAVNGHFEVTRFFSTFSMDSRRERCQKFCKASQQISEDSSEFFCKFCT